MVHFLLNQITFSFLFNQFICFTCVFEGLNPFIIPPQHQTNTTQRKYKELTSKRRRRWRWNKKSVCADNNNTIKVWFPFHIFRWRVHHYILSIRFASVWIWILLICKWRRISNHYFYLHTYIIKTVAYPTYTATVVVFIIQLLNVYISKEFKISSTH